MPYPGSSFEVLKQVDSTNNYAMAMVRAGMAKHGNAWFSSHQTAGKGQRGKSWVTEEGHNIALSVVLTPQTLKIIHPFQLSAAVALASFDFFSSYAGDEVQIKWPNDIYWRDRKAGGILIENKFSGNQWKWAVVGIGLNINQTKFDDSLTNPVSLIQITGKIFSPEELARELHESILKRTSQFLTKSYDTMLEEYNRYLYKREQSIRLKKDNMVFETVVKGVSAKGQLLTLDAMERHFEFGEVEWIIQ